MLPVTWRAATHADLPRIQELWKAQEEYFHKLAPTVLSPMPELFYPIEETGHAFYPYKPPILRVQMAEKNGEVVACRIVEAVCEVQLIGGDEDVVRSLAKELPEECQWARSKGFRSGWGLAPRQMAKPIERSLRHTPLRTWPDLILVGCQFEELGD